MNGHNQNFVTRSGRGRGRGRGGGRNGPTMFDQLHTIAKLVRSAPQKFQVLLFSATFPQNILKLSTSLGCDNPFRVKVEKKELGLKNIRNVTIECENDRNKFEVLKDILMAYKLAQVIIFTNTIKKTEQLHRNLAHNEDFEMDAALLVGSMNVCVLFCVFFGFLF